MDIEFYVENMSKFPAKKQKSHNMFNNKQLERRALRAFPNLSYFRVSQ